MREPVLVADSLFAKAGDIFRASVDVNCIPAPAEELALAAAISTHSARVAIVGTTPYRGPLYEALGRHNGALIARFGVGHDSIDKALARKHGIVVTNTPGVLDASVAEHAIGLMVCIARRIPQCDATMRDGGFTAPCGVELYGKTLGILGFGSIGRRVAAIAHFGIGMNVIACSRHAPAEPLAQSGIERFTSDVEELFRVSDMVSVHLSSNAATKRFIDAERLAWLKPGALLINTARGAVLDEAALYDALVAGRLAGAALDVFEREPYVPVEPDKDLRKLENVVLAPHVGSNTREANRRMAEAALENVRRFLAGQLDRLTRVDQAS